MSVWRSVEEEAKDPVRSLIIQARVDGGGFRVLDVYQKGMDVRKIGRYFTVCLFYI